MIPDHEQTTRMLRMKTKEVIRLTLENAKLKHEVEKLRGVLMKVASYIGGHPLSREQVVGKSDGTNKVELVPTYSAELLQECNSALGIRAKDDEKK